MKITASCLALFTALLLSGCANKPPSPSHYSGFLGDYAQLQFAKTASGTPVMRWVSPDFKPENYRSVLVEKPQIVPAATTNSQVSQQTLNEIALYLQQAMRTELSARVRVVDYADSDTLVLRSAITAVELSPEGLKFYEVIPAALVVAAVSAVIGTRDLNTEIYLELEGIDARNSQPVARVVRKDHGLQLENKSTQLSLNDIKPALDAMAMDARNYQP